MVNPVKKRFSELDALRGIAAIAVVLFHFTFGYDNGFTGLSNDKFYFKYGYLGVNLFFIISGFVIFMTLEKTKDSRSFFVSRFSRLYPAYWTAIILTVLLTTVINAPILKHMYTFKQVIVNFTMLQSFVKINDVDGAYWTLAVELVFYFWMWVIFKLKKLQYINWVALAWTIFSGLCAASNFGFKKYVNVIFIAPFAPLFMAGILFYLLKTKKGNLLTHVFIFATLVFELYFEYKLKTTVNPEGRFDIIPSATITIFYIVFYLFAYNRLVGLSGKLLGFLGGISYSLYLIHENIGYGIIYWLKRICDNALFFLPITIGIVVTLAWLINKYVEKPAMRKIRDYYKKKDNIITNRVTS